MDSVRLRLYGLSGDVRAIFRYPNRLRLPLETRRWRGVDYDFFAFAFLVEHAEHTEAVLVL